MNRLGWLGIGCYYQATGDGIEDVMYGMMDSDSLVRQVSFLISRALFLLRFLVFSQFTPPCSALAATCLQGGFVMCTNNAVGIAERCC